MRSRKKNVAKDNLPNECQCMDRQIDDYRQVILGCTPTFLQPPCQATGDEEEEEEKVGANVNGRERKRYSIESE